MKVYTLKEQSMMETPRNKTKSKYQNYFSELLSLVYETSRTKHNIFSEFCLKHERKLRNG